MNVLSQYRAIPSPRLLSLHQVSCTTAHFATPPRPISLALLSLRHIQPHVIAALTSGMSAIEQANADIARGDLGSARRRLTSYLATVGYDQQLACRVAELSLQMHDPGEAARWFAMSDPTHPDAAEPLHALLSSCNGEPSRLRAKLPLLDRLAGVESLPRTVEEFLASHGIERQKPAIQKPRHAPRLTELVQIAAAAGCLLLFLALLVIGAITILKWLIGA